MIEHEGFAIIADDVKLNFINIDITPKSCCTPSYRLNLNLLVSSHKEDTLIVGDFKAHNSSWFSQIADD